MIALIVVLLCTACVLCVINIARTAKVYRQYTHDKEHAVKEACRMLDDRILEMFHYCPRCHSKNIIHVKNPFDENVSAWVCPQCELIGPDGNTKVDALLRMHDAFYGQQLKDKENGEQTVGDKAQ